MRLAPALPNESASRTWNGAGGACLSEFHTARISPFGRFQHNDNARRARWFRSARLSLDPRLGLTTPQNCGEHRHGRFVQLASRRQSRAGHRSVIRDRRGDRTGARRRRRDGRAGGAPRRSRSGLGREDRAGRRKRAAARRRRDPPGRDRAHPCRDGLGRGWPRHPRQQCRRDAAVTACRSAQGGFAADGRPQLGRS